MSNLDQLQKEVEDILFREHYPNMERFLPNDKKTFREIIDHIRAATVRECIEALPKAGEDPGDFGGIDDKEVRATWWGRYAIIEEAKRKLQALSADTEPSL